MLSLAESGETRLRRDPGDAAGADRRPHRPTRAPVQGIPPAGLRDRPSFSKARALSPSKAKMSQESSRTCSLRDLVVRESRPRSRTRFPHRFKHVLIRGTRLREPPKSARATHHARFADWLGERAGTSCSRSAPTTSNRQRRCWPSSTVRRWLSWPRKAATLQEAGRRPRPRGEPGGAPRVPASRGARRRSSGATLARNARGAWTTRRSPARWRPCARRLRRADQGLEGRALTALADMALMREADLAALASSPTRRSPCST